MLEKEPERSRLLFLPGNAPEVHPGNHRPSSLPPYVTSATIFILARLSQATALLGGACSVEDKLGCVRTDGFDGDDGSDADDDRIGAEEAMGT